MQRSIADSSTTASPILDPIAADCWARCQPHSRIKDLPVASRLRKSLTLARVVFIDTLVIPELDGGFLHNRWADPRLDCGRLLVSTPALPRYKGCLCRIEAPEIADYYSGCLYMFPGDPRARYQIPPQPLLRSLTQLRGIVGLDASLPIM